MRDYPEIAGGDGSIHMDEGMLGLTAFSVRGLRFDNEDGLGAVPAMRTIANAGVLVTMTPAVFLSLIPELDPGDIRKTPKLLDSREAPLGTPFLVLRLATGSDRLEVRQHEGTHRMRWIGENLGYDTEIPVGILAQEDHYQLRPREIEPDFVSRVAAGVYREKSDVFVDGPLFARAVWSGGTFGPEPEDRRPAFR